MNYAQDIFNQCANQWNNLTEKDKDNYLKKYVKTYKQKKTKRASKKKPNMS